MLIEEVLSTQVGIAIESNAIDLALLNNALSGATEYVAETHRAGVENALVDILFSIMMLQSQSEGDASVSYNYEGIKQRLLFLAKKLNRSEILDYLEPSVTNKPIW
jgi:hypothetical protein